MERPGVEPTGPTTTGKEAPTALPMAMPVSASGGMQFPYGTQLVMGAGNTPAFFLVPSGTVSIFRGQDRKKTGRAWVRVKDDKKPRYVGDGWCMSLGTGSSRSPRKRRSSFGFVCVLLFSPLASQLLLFVPLVCLHPWFLLLTVLVLIGGLCCAMRCWPLSL